MFRPALSLSTLVICAIVAVGRLDAADPAKKLTAEERKQLESQVGNLEAAGDRAYRSGKFNEAVAAFTKVLAVTRQLYSEADFPDGHNEIAHSLNNLAFMYYVQGKARESEPFYVEALEMRQRLFPGDHADVAHSLTNLAAAYSAQGKYKLAVSHYEDGLAMKKRLRPEDHPDVAETMTVLAHCHKNQMQLTEAEQIMVDVLAMYQRLHKGDHPDVAQSLNNLGVVHLAQGKFELGEKHLKDSLVMRQRLFKGDHADISASLINLAVAYRGAGKLAEAQPFFNDALAMRRRLYSGDHPEVADALLKVADLYDDLQRPADAEPAYQDALAMYQRVYPGDHPKVAVCLNNLGRMYHDQGKLARAQPLLEAALAMRRKLYRGDHVDLATSMNNLAAVYRDDGRLDKAEALYKDTLAMLKRIGGQNADIGGAVNNVARIYKEQGKLSEAIQLYEESLEFHERPENRQKLPAALQNLAGAYSEQGRLADAERLYKRSLALSREKNPGDHPELALCINNIASYCRSQGKLAAAERHYKDAQEMYKRLTTAYATQTSEGEVLTLLATQPRSRDGYLSVVRLRAAAKDAAYDPSASFATLWSAKGAVSRVYEQRQLRARAAGGDATLTRKLNDLASARNRRAGLLFAPAVEGARADREGALKSCEETIARLNRELAAELPTVQRIQKLDAATVSDLQQALPANAALVDYVRYTFMDVDPTAPLGKQETREDRYVAFVVTKDKLAWIDLEAAGKIDPAVAAWRESIASGAAIPKGTAQEVRNLVWSKVRKALPAGIKTVCICPDAALCRLPFVALPGDRPGTILLEDFAVTTVPHATFVLDQIWPREETSRAPAHVLVVGGVTYDAKLKPTDPQRSADSPNDQKQFVWKFLEGTVVEVEAVERLARGDQLPAIRLSGEDATTGAVLMNLPKARIAHLATHGFFADASLRNVLDLDEGNFQKSWRGERIGKAATSPLVMAGLVLAGANARETSSRGILTGESLVDLDLSGLELAVLSACDTHVGELAGGEGVFGLQRAFHYAGTRNVVASLWKVPDAPTAALMHEFYENLWERDLPPVEALRQAQLQLYRNPKGIPALAKEFRGTFQVRPGAADEGPIDIEAKAHPVKWAAFTLSGLGR